MSNLAKLKTLYDELGKKQIKVGFFETSKYPDGTPIAYVAAIQEIGYAAGGIPPRPFLRPAMKQNQAGYQQLIRQGVAAATAGTITIHGALDQIGAKAAADVKLAISAVTTPALKESTVKVRSRRHSKGKSTNKPLVDTGQMLQAVTWSVEGK